LANSDLINELLAQFNANPRRVFARLANEYRKAGDPQSAIDLCRTHVPLQPTYISGHIVFGQALFEQGELDEARTAFETAISLDPENLIAIRQLGDIARVTGDSRGARTWYERLLEMDPQNEEIEQYLHDLPEATPDQPVEAPTAMAEDAETVATEQPPALPPVPTAESVSQAPAGTAPDVSEIDMPEPSWPEPVRNETPQEPIAVEHTADGELTVPAPPDAMDAGIERQHDPFDWSMLAPSVEPATSDAESLIDVSDLSPDEPAAAGLAEQQATVPERSASEVPGFDMNAVMFPEIELSESPADEPLPESAAQLLGGEIDLPRTPAALSEPSAHTDEQVKAAALSPATDTSAADGMHDTEQEAATEPESAMEPEPAAPHASAEPAAEPVGATAFVTETLAELYLRQGHLTEAMAIYHQVAARRPDDAALQERIARLEATQASRVSMPRAGRTVRELFASVMTRRAPVPDAPDARAIGTAEHTTEATAASAPSGSPVGADGLFAVDVVRTEDDARAGVLAAAYLADTVREVSPDTTPDAGSFSLEHVFRDEPGPATLPSASMADLSFDEFFARKPEETPPEQHGSDASPAEAKPGDDDLELFQAWLEGLKK
jgi:tetratricopeptide (TPR) repeat protein